MGGFFGIASSRECIEDAFYGTDYHSHLGTQRAGLAAYSVEKGIQRTIHNIKNAPFRTKFDHVLEEMAGTSAVGCISDSDPQPLMLRSKLGTFAICTVGRINNGEELLESYISRGGQFNAMPGGVINATELVAALISQEQDFAAGVAAVYDCIDGAMNILILKEDGNIIVSRDGKGRLPVLIGKDESGHAVAMESFAYEKLGYVTEKELGPGEIVELTAGGIRQLTAPGEEMHMCSFMWSYYGYSTSTYEGVNVEVMRYRNGRILAQTDKMLNNTEGVDYVSGVPDSGTPHAIGYANESGIPFSRPFIKYTPTWTRSFMPAKQSDRIKIAKMKQVPVRELIRDKSLLFVDDSIVRGTQLQETVSFLYENGAKDVHMRSACPPIMYSCKYLNFSRATGDMDLIARRTIVELEGEEGLNHIDQYCDGNTQRGQKMRKAICEKLHLASLEFQSIDGVINAIGLPECKLCTYCWNGKE